MLSSEGRECGRWIKGKARLLGTVRKVFASRFDGVDSISRDFSAIMVMREAEADADDTAVVSLDMEASM